MDRCPKRFSPQTQYIYTHLRITLCIHIYTLYIYTYIHLLCHSHSYITYILYIYIYVLKPSRWRPQHKQYKLGKKETKTVYNLLYMCSRTNGINSAYYQYWSPVITRRRRERVHRRQRDDSKNTQTICVGENITRRSESFNFLRTLGSVRFKTTWYYITP